MIAPEKENIEGADASWLKSLLLEIDGRMQAGKGRRRYRTGSWSRSSELEEKYYVNSDGSEVECRTPRIHFFGILTAIAERGGRAEDDPAGGDRRAGGRGEAGPRLQGRGGGADTAPGARQGDEVSHGVMDVILSPELSGIAAHESVGHPQEADRILGREGAQAGESYLKKDSIGFKVGSREANISDDPTLAHSNGYAPSTTRG